MHTLTIIVISSVVCFLVVDMASELNQQSSDPRSQGGPHPLKRPLFTDISGAEEAVVRLAFEINRQNVSKDIQALNRMVSGLKSNGGISE